MHNDTILAAKFAHDMVIKALSMAGGLQIWHEQKDELLDIMLAYVLRRKFNYDDDDLDDKLDDLIDPDLEEPYDQWFDNEADDITDDPCCDTCLDLISQNNR